MCKMKSSVLLKMANQIGAFFEAMPDQDEAAHQVAAHLTRYWAPQMRRDLIERLSCADDGEVKPIILKAVQALTNLPRVES